ncbi:fimbrial protein [Providencia sp. wls1921]|uniref:fimbrial protein n=1 Tax=Providencia sp. wls1921 TaxID=2675153 RepID=UPI0012B6631D|nr:fimbrial protein [Providencia sp. wls1921]MTC42583.1 fimbrial protein [Providencia sp. wls1921]
MKKLIANSVLAVGCLYTGYANAICVQNPALNNVITTVTPRTFNILYDDISVRNLSVFEHRYASQGLYAITTNPGTCGAMRWRYAYANSWKPNANYIANTNIPGIGVKIMHDRFYLNNGPEPFYVPYDNTHHILGINTPMWTVTFIKTGRVTQSGALSSGVIGHALAYNPYPRTTFTLASLYFPTDQIKVNVLQCSLKNNQSVYNIELGDWRDTQFKNIGDASDAIDVPITLTCNPGTNIKTTVTSSSGYIDQNTGKLALSGADKATGVAIQLLDKNNTPIKLNTSNISQSNVPEGDYVLGWKARYIKTADKITPGSANATATVNIRYE